MKTGTFIVFDGNDGSGKATQAKILSKRFASAGIPSEKIDFPHYEKNFFGSFIGECLAGKHGDFLALDPKIASTLYASDRFESLPVMRKALETGKVLIADRYVSANQIHQGGKITDEKEREAFLLWLDKMEHEVFGIPRPNAIIYLRVPVEVSVELVVKKEQQKNKNLKTPKDVVEESRLYLENSFATANWLAAHQPNWTVIDCMENGSLRSPESIHEEVWKAVEKAIS